MPLDGVAEHVDGRKTYDQHVGLAVFAGSERLLDDGAKVVLDDKWAERATRNEDAAGVKLQL